MGNKRRSPPTRKAKAFQEVVVVPISVREGRRELTPGQYLHIKDQIKDLTGFGARAFSTQLRISPFEEFWELKDKGGVLGKKNIRVYFYFDQNANEVIVLMTDKKEDDGAACPAIKYILRNRLRLYQSGHFDGQLIRYVRPALRGLKGT